MADSRLVTVLLNLTVTAEFGVTVSKCLLDYLYILLLAGYETKHNVKKYLWLIICG